MPIPVTSDVSLEQLREGGGVGVGVGGGSREERENKTTVKEEFEF